MADVAEAALAPDFDIPAAGGAVKRLSSLRGRPAVVYFYPKDDTPGCTREAVDFSAAITDFDRLGVTVIGVSKDSAKMHNRFAEKYDLRVALVSDPDLDIINRYGVWVEKSMYGRTYMGVERATFLIDQSGRIARIWRKVRVPGHVAEVLAATQEIGGTRPLSRQERPARKGKINPDGL